MPIPDFQTIMPPLLRYCADGFEHSKRDVVPAPIKVYSLAEEVDFPENWCATFDNRVYDR